MRNDAQYETALYETALYETVAPPNANEALLPGAFTKVLNSRAFTGVQSISSTFSTIMLVAHLA
ncbi:hypothetical protein JOD55_001187 [Arcanobacterium pluranimalium]|uniref:hypothetical protein n=1 Tax=Arcanobacterium pluranimalium TaxID=108028 RepID=UPI00195AA7FD|nr:hypothetical protein [Arcanobacterium pluranimalium]MBM7825360.1 hypothetical protein [Arcanobacterium pluranimalium]